jgi:hypothetical protein
MTTLIDNDRVRGIATDSTRYFYFYMALSCSAVAFLGFAPTYFLPLTKPGWRRRGGSSGIARSG